MKDIPALKGGDLIFRAGEGTEKVCAGGSIIFQLPIHTEFLKICADGKVYVKGELVDTNQQLYVAFKAWMDRAIFLYEGKHAALQPSISDSDLPPQEGELKRDRG